MAVLDAAGVDRAHVIAHSMGGRIAQWLAIDAPSRVASLILIATSAGPRDGTKTDAAAVSDLLAGGERRRRLFFDDGWTAANSELVDRFFGLTADREVLRGLFAASRGHDSVDELERITAPTLVIQGRADRLAPLESGRFLAARIPSASLLEVAGALHGLHLADPLVLAAEIEFIRDAVRS